MTLSELDAAIDDAMHVWDREATENKVHALYDGMAEDYVPTWERFPEMQEVLDNARRDREELERRRHERKLRQQIEDSRKYENMSRAALSYFGPTDF